MTWLKNVRNYNEETRTNIKNDFPLLQTVEQIFNFKFLFSAYARAQARTRARAGYTFIMDNKQPYVV